MIHSKDPARKTDGTLIGTAYFQHLLRLLVRYARLLGKPEDAQEYEALSAKMREAFHKRFSLVRSMIGGVCDRPAYRCMCRKRRQS